MCNLGKHCTSAFPNFGAMTFGASSYVRRGRLVSMGCGFTIPMKDLHLSRRWIGMFKILIPHMHIYILWHKDFLNFSGPFLFRCITLAKPLKPAVKVKPAIVEQEQKPRVENYASPGKSPDCDIDIIPLSKLEGHINSQTSLLPKKTVKAAGASNSSKGLSIADVSAGLISPSDITGFMRQFPKRD